MRRRISGVGVIGSGVMGSAIAGLMAGAGRKTLLLDMVPPELSDDEKQDVASRNRIVQAGLIRLRTANPPLLRHPDDAELITIGNLEDDFGQLQHCDWVIEAVIEDLEIKRDLFARLESVRHPVAIVSTNTSGLPLEALAAGRSQAFRRHFLGTHFFNPVRQMKLLELVPAGETLPEVTDFLADFGERVLGKGIVRAKDRPTFVANRIGLHSVVTTMRRMLSEGLSIREVDALFGPALGRPQTAVFETCDLVGLDTFLQVAQNAYNLLAEDEERESFRLPEFLVSMVEKGLLGRKTGAGFYRTPPISGAGAPRLSMDPGTLSYEEQPPAAFPCLHAAEQAATLPEKVRAIAYGEDRGAAFAWKVLAATLIYAANRLGEIADTIVELDRAMRWGFNFELGPFETWDALGVEEAVRRMEADGLAVPLAIKEMLAGGHRAFYRVEDGRLCYFDFTSGEYQAVPADPARTILADRKAAGKTLMTCPSASLVDLGDDVFCFEIHTEMNVVNQEVVEFMGRCLDYVDECGAGLVIGNQRGGFPGEFSTGADLNLLYSLAKARKYSEIEVFVRHAQCTLQQARYTGFPIVAAPYGLTLGGGCEICLGSADRIVAHAELNMGLVETRVGLLPAGGGCLNFWKRLLQAIPPGMSGIDLMPCFQAVFMAITGAKISSSAEDARSIGFLGPADRIVFNRDHLIGEAKKEVLRLDDQGYIPPLRRKVRVVGEAARGMVAVHLHGQRAGQYLSAYDTFLAGRIAEIISGGQVRADSEIDEDVILTLERETFLELWREPKTLARVEHMLESGQPLRN